MRGIERAMLVWPGLPGLWLRGSWLALGLALVWAAVLNVALLSTWGWTELIAPEVRAGAWLLVVGIWALSLRYSGRTMQVAKESAKSVEPDLFPAALDEYLRGNWLGVESVCQTLLRRRTEDVEARLLLATMYRHCGRTQEARQQLDRLSQYEQASRWQAEIAYQRQALELAAQSDAPPTENPSQPTSSAADNCPSDPRADKEAEPTQSCPPQDSITQDSITQNSTTQSQSRKDAA